MYSCGTKNRAKGFRLSKKKSQERVREQIGDHGGSPRPNIAGIHRLSGLHQRRARNRASAQGAKRLRRRGSGRAILPSDGVAQRL